MEWERAMADHWISFGFKRRDSVEEKASTPSSLLATDVATLFFGALLEWTPPPKLPVVGSTELSELPSAREYFISGWGTGPVPAHEVHIH